MSSVSTSPRTGSDEPERQAVRFHLRDVVSTLLPVSNPLHDTLHVRPTAEEMKIDAEMGESAALIELQSPKVQVREGHSGPDTMSTLGAAHAYAHDPYAFHMDKSFRQHTVPPVSKHTWNVPLKRQDKLPEHTDLALPHALHWPLFAFPYNVNVINARVVGVLCTGICAVIIAYRKERWAYYLTLFLFADYMLRFLFGARGSFVGSVAEIFSYYLPRKWTSGPPKQFASLCGAMFSGASTLLFFLSADKDNIAAAVIIGLLMGCTALEGFLDICMGCIFFKLGQRFHIFPPSATQRAEDVYDETEKTSEEADFDIDRASQPQLNILVPDGERRVPLTYKSSTDAQKRANFHPIKHMNGAHYLIPMGLAGLAIMWQLAQQGPYPSVPKVVWHIIAVSSGSVWGVFFLCHVLKAVLYPHKLRAEWEHPQHRHFLCALPITLLLFSYLAAAGDQKDLAEVLFWIGGPIQLSLTCVIVTSWFRHIHHQDHFSPAWMMAPLGNLVAAIVLPVIRGGKFIEVAWLWFSIGVFMWVIMTTLSVSRLTFRAPLEDSLRSSVFMLLAAPSVIMIAWLSIHGAVLAAPGMELDDFARFSFYVAIVFSLILACLTFTAYFGRNKFDISYWGYAFPLDTIAIAAISYHSYQGQRLTDAIASIFILLATCVQAILAAHTVLGLVSRNNGIFLGDEKSGPLAFMRMFHYAIKDSLAHLTKLSNQFSHADKIDEFCREFVEFRVVLETHMRHEEEVFFVAFRTLWPGCTIDADDEHDHDAVLVARLHGLVDRVQSTAAGPEREALLVDIQKLLPEVSKSTLGHIASEEAHLQFMAIKYIPLSWQYRLSREIWDSTSAQDWALVIPFVLRHQWVHSRRVKFLAALRWGLTEHIQQIGHWVYEGVSPLLFDRLLVDIPELAPRHIRGHYRIW